MPSQEAPTGGGGVVDDSGFAGGFTGDHEVTLRELGPAPWGGGWPTVETRDTTLAELREFDDGGYLTSDQWLPANESPASIAGLQTMLVEAGLLDLNDLDHDTLGFYDDATRGAFLDLLARSNAAGTTWETTLSRLRRNPMAMSRKPSGPTRQPFVAEVTHPDDIKRVLKDALREKVGRGNLLDDEALGKIASAYQSQQVAYQKQLYDMSATGAAGGTAVRPPDIETMAIDEAKKADPVAFGAHEVLDKFSVLSDMLRGGS